MLRASNFLGLCHMALSSSEPIHTAASFQILCLFGFGFGLFVVCLFFSKMSQNTTLPLIRTLMLL